MTRCADRPNYALVCGLLRAAERGNVESAAQYGRLVYSGRLEAGSRDPATKWTRTAAVKENPLGQYTYALMRRNGWFGEEQRAVADDWHRKALGNGFSAEMLQFP